MVDKVVLFDAKGRTESLKISVEVWALLKEMKPYLELFTGSRF